ncbi:protein boule-like [Orbicella faveolata]|uniref:protein boule-like n=1 Tax=Orbicella faveolata TaxID=48498 RepID=UPI0009E56C78|nr:protein boule-like [Orbicella faveolata]
MQVSYKYDSSSHNSRSPLEVWTEHGIQVLNRVFVRGIPNKMTELQLEILFGGMGYVQNVRIVEDVKTGANKGYGFVTFRTAEEARKVQEMGLVRWNDNVLQVDVAVKRKAKSRVLKQQYAMPQCTPVYVMVQPGAGLPIIMEGNVWCQELNQMLPLENWMQS